MKKQHLFIILSVVLLGFVFGVIQYYQALKTEDVSAVTVGIPNPGHSLAQLECSADSLCVDTVNNRVGIGTANPGSMLDVQGTVFWKGKNVAAAANGGTVTEVSGNYPANNSAPYTTDAGSLAYWGSGHAIDGCLGANDANCTWLDANGENGITFIKVTFNNTYIIDRVRLAGRYDNTSAFDGQPQDFQLDFSDGSVQTFTFPSNYSGMQEYNIKPVATSFIRYTTRSKYAGGNNGLREIEAYTRYVAVNGTLTDSKNIFYNTAKGSQLNTNVGIGTTSPGYTLTVAGTAWVTSGSWSGSDIRWKKNIETLSQSSSLEKVMALNPVNYQWKTDEYPEMKFSNGTQLGFIAQDVEKIIPEVVTTNNEGYKGISYEKIVPVLTSAIQEQEKKIDALSSQNQSLKILVCSDHPLAEVCK